MRRHNLLIIALTVALVGCSSASEGGDGDAAVSGPDGIEAATDASSEEGTETTDGTAGKDSDEALSCQVLGCDGEYCVPASSEPLLDRDVICDPKPEHACLELTTCGVLGDGTCGWDQNEAYLACLEEVESDPTDASESSDGDVEPVADSEAGPTDTQTVDDTEAVDDSEVEAPQDAMDEDTTEPVDGEAGPVTDAEATADSGVATDTVGDAAEDTGEADAGPVTLIDEIVPITEESQYDKGELYGMGVDLEGRVSLFWRAERADGLHDLVVSQSDPQVSAFAPPVTVVEGVAPLGITAGGGLEMDGSSHMLTWRDDPSDGVSRIMFRRAEMPALEGADLILSESNTHTLYRPHVAWRAPSTACVLWQKSGGNDTSDVMMRCSADGGVNFAEEVAVNPIEATASVSDAVFAFSGELYVAYHAKPTASDPVRVYVRVTDDMGLTWSDPLDMSTLGGAEEGFDPTLVRGMDGILHLAWYNGLPGIQGQAWISHLEAGGAWTTPELMPTIQSQIGLRPGRGSVLHASGEDAKFGYGCIANPPPDCGIQVMSSYDSGGTWGDPAPLPVTPDTTLLGHDMVANLVEGYLHIAWWETLPNQMTKMTLKFITIEE
jgi:hypothetical protein